jgi:hypothetical protein
MTICLLLLLLAQVAPPPPPPAPGPPAPPENVILQHHRARATAEAQALRALPRDPTIAKVQRAALDRVAIDRRTARRWRRRARASAALPVIRGEYTLRTDEGWKLDQEAGLADELSQDVGAGHGVSIRATWELDRLLFDSNELRAARAALDVDRERERVLVLVTQLYFERLQLLLDDALEKPASAPSTSTSGRISRLVRLAEIEAMLHAMTGLEFPRDARSPTNAPTGAIAPVPHPHRSARP